MDDALVRAQAELEHLRRRVEVFGRIHDALARLREVSSVEAMIDRTPAGRCAPRATSTASWSSASTRG